MSANSGIAAGQPTASSSRSSSSSSRDTSSTMATKQRGKSKGMRQGHAEAEMAGPEVPGSSASARGPAARDVVSTSSASNASCSSSSSSSSPRVPPPSLPLDTMAQLGLTFKAEHQLSPLEQQQLQLHHQQQLQQQQQPFQQQHPSQHPSQHPYQHLSEHHPPPHHMMPYAHPPPPMMQTPHGWVPAPPMPPQLFSEPPIQATTTSSTTSAASKPKKDAPSSANAGASGRHEHRHMWTVDETEALREGCTKHGVGNWKAVLNDPEFRHRFSDDRNPGDLKDRFRTKFPEAYHELYPNAKTHVTPAAVRKASESSAIGIKSQFEKGKNKERRNFTPAEDAVLKQGYSQHGASWTLIAKDPVFEGRRKPTDLRDRFRNAFPELYEQAGYKPRSKGSKSKDRRLSHGSSHVPHSAHDHAPQLPSRQGHEDADLKNVVMPPVEPLRQQQRPPLHRSGTSDLTTSSVASTTSESSNPTSDPSGAQQHVPSYRDWSSWHHNRVPPPPPPADMARSLSFGSAGVATGGGGGGPSGGRPAFLPQMSMPYGAGAGMGAFNSMPYAQAMREGLIAEQAFAPSTAPGSDAGSDFAGSFGPGMGHGKSVSEQQQRQQLRSADSNASASADGALRRTQSLKRGRNSERIEPTAPAPAAPLPPPWALSTDEQDGRVSAPPGFDPAAFQQSGGAMYGPGAGQSSSMPPSQAPPADYDPNSLSASFDDDQLRQINQLLQDYSTQRGPPSGQGQQSQQQQQQQVQQHQQQTPGDAEATAAAMAALMDIDSGRAAGESIGASNRGAGGPSTHPWNQQGQARNGSGSSFVHAAATPSSYLSEAGQAHIGGFSPRQMQQLQLHGHHGGSGSDYSASSFDVSSASVAATQGSNGYGASPPPLSSASSSTSAFDRFAAMQFDGFGPYREPIVPAPPSEGGASVLSDGSLSSHGGSNNNNGHPGFDFGDLAAVSLRSNASASNSASSTSSHSNHSADERDAYDYEDDAYDDEDERSFAAARQQHGGDAHAGVGVDLDEDEDGLPRTQTIQPRRRSPIVAHKAAAESSNQYNAVDEYVASQQQQQPYDGNDNVTFSSMSLGRPRRRSTDTLREDVEAEQTMGDYVAMAMFERERENEERDLQQQQQQQGSTPLADDPFLRPGASRSSLGGSAFPTIFETHHEASASSSNNSASLSPRGPGDELAAAGMTSRPTPPSAASSSRSPSTSHVSGGGGGGGGGVRSHSSLSAAATAGGLDLDTLGGEHGEFVEEGYRRDDGERDEAEEDEDDDDSYNFGDVDISSLLRGRAPLGPYIDEEAQRRGDSSSGGMGNGTAGGHGNGEGGSGEPRSRQGSGEHHADGSTAAGGTYRSGAHLSPRSWAEVGPDLDVSLDLDSYSPPPDWYGPAPGREGTAGSDEDAEGDDDDGEDGEGPGGTH